MAIVHLASTDTGPQATVTSPNLTSLLLLSSTSTGSVTITGAQLAGLIEMAANAITGLAALTTSDLLLNLVELDGTVSGIALASGWIPLAGFSVLMSGTSSSGKWTSAPFTLNGPTKLVLVVDNPPAPPRILGSYGISQQNNIGLSGAVFVESKTGNMYEGGFLVCVNSQDVSGQDLFHLNLNWFTTGLSWTLYAQAFTSSAVGAF
jgi:hypothetical protein